MATISLSAAIQDPTEAALALERELAYVVYARGLSELRQEAAGGSFGVIHRLGARLLIRVRPSPELARMGYPVEDLLIYLGPSDLYSIRPAWRSGDWSRGFEHRNGDGSLCLEMPEDPPDRQWSPANGLESLVYNGARHMWFEESYRRTGKWPIEDAPHGYP